MQRGFCLMWLAASSVLVVIAGSAAPITAARAAEPAVLPALPTRTAPAAPAESKPKKWLAWPKLPWAGASAKSASPAPAETKAPKGQSGDQQKVEGQVSIARLAERRGQAEQAELVYQNLLQKHPDLTAPHHRLGVLAARRGEFQKANEHFQTALRSGSKDAELLSDVGYCYYLQNRLDDAERLYQQALSLEPNNQAACNNVAMLLADKGRFDESLAMFQRVNSTAQAHTNLAFMLTQAGQFEQAEVHFNRALTLDSTLRPAATGLLQLAEHRKQSQLATRPAPGTPPGPPASERGKALATTGDMRRPSPPTADPAESRVRLASQETIAPNAPSTTAAPAERTLPASPTASAIVAAEPIRLAPKLLSDGRAAEAPPATLQAAPTPHWLPAENVSRPRTPAPYPPETPSDARAPARRTVNSRLSDREESVPPSAASRAPASTSAWPSAPEGNPGFSMPNPPASVAPTSPRDARQAAVPSMVMPSIPPPPALPNWWGGNMTPSQQR